MAINKCRVSKSNASLTAVRIGSHHGRSELQTPSAFISCGASTTTLPYDHITSVVTMLFGPSDDIAYGDNVSI